MEEKLADLLKAASKSLAAHFKKSAAFHDKMAAEHEKCSMAHKAHQEVHEACMGKAEDPQHNFHKGSAAFHKTMCGQHSGIQKCHSSQADHMRKMFAAHSEQDETKKISLINEFLTEMGEEVLKTVTPEPQAPATPAVAAPPAPAGDPAPATSVDQTLEKKLDSAIGTALDAALDRVLKSDEFGKKIDEAISNTLLSKLGSAVVPTPVKSVPVPRTDGMEKKVVAPPTPAEAQTFAKAVDPELSDFVSVEGLQ